MKPTQKVGAGLTILTLVITFLGYLWHLQGVRENLYFEDSGKGEAILTSFVAALIGLVSIILLCTGKIDKKIIGFLLLNILNPAVLIGWLLIITISYEVVFLA